MKREGLSVILRHRFFFVYALSAISLFVGAIFISQTRENLNDIDKANPFEYLLASAASWSAPSDSYFNSKVLMPTNVKNFVGFNFGQPSCNEDWCFKYSINQGVEVGNSWYPSALGVTADISRWLYQGLLSLGFKPLPAFLVPHAFNLTLNIAFFFLLYLRLINPITARFGRLFCCLILFSPWVIFGSFNVVFSPAVRFAPLYLLLLLGKEQLQRISYKFFSLFALSFSASTLHGYEFFPFSLAAIFLYLVSIGVKQFRTSLFFIYTSLVGLLLSLLAQFSVARLNSISFENSVSLVLHTVFKHNPLVEVSGPAVAVDSGTQSLGIFDGFYKLTFNTSYLLPHPFPKQLIDWFGLSATHLQLLFLVTSLFPVLLALFSRLIATQGFMVAPLFFFIFVFSLSCFALNSWVFNHPHHLGIVSAILVLISAKILDGSKNSKD